jgi:AmiR/NasT family two-component response regulator
VCELLAGAVSNVLQELELRDELRTLAADMENALSSRAVIDQAKGIVMADKHISADEAFEHLTELSSTLHIKLRDLARMLVDEAGSGPG